MDNQSAFKQYLYADNKEGSGKASSYVRALELLEAMVRAVPLGFEDCQDIRSVHSVERLIELRTKVQEEQRKGSESSWMLEKIPTSYLRDGYCSAALTQLIEFLQQEEFATKVLGVLNDHKGDDPNLVTKLNGLDPKVPDGMVHEPKSKDGLERTQEIKTRIGQRAFRKLILEIYGNRCCLTGIDLPEVNRASHIIGWAERKETRMDPRNGLCLSATYDAAFDRKLISFDEKFRLVLSKQIRNHVPSEALEIHFLSRAGQQLELPTRYHPLGEYLEAHRRGGEF